MLVYLGGRERGVAEIDVLAQTVGLEVVAVHAAGINSIVEMRAK